MTTNRGAGVYEPTNGGILTGANTTKHQAMRLPYFRSQIGVNHG